MTRWDVTYTRGDRTLVVEVTAATFTLARADALPLVGSRGRIVRIDATPLTIPTTDPATRVIQGDDR